MDKNGNYCNELYMDYYKDPFLHTYRAQGKLLARAQQNLLFTKQ